jgi:hypothetical protein
MILNLNLFLETILILFAILASNGIIYSLTFFNLNTKNSSENISVITNSSEKDVLTLTSLIASNPMRLTSSDSSASQTLSVSSSDSNTSQTLSVTSSDSSASQTLSVTSSETNVSQDMSDSINWTDYEIGEGMMTHTENSYLACTNEGTNVGIFDNTISLDSLTILNTQSLEEWREIAMDLQELPINTPAGILQQVKFEELNILYSQDIIHFGITQTELRLIIEHLPAMSLFDPGINHLILTIMSYYHL